MWKRPHFLSYILLILLRVLLVCRNEYELRIIVFESIIIIIIIMYIVCVSYFEAKNDAFAHRIRGMMFFLSTRKSY